MHKESYRKIFVISFSVLIIFTFYMLVSSNGFILGNDPAIHLSKTYEILETGTVSFSEITWYPPLYRILLAECIIFTGASNFESALFIMKSLTVTFDWLLIFSVYLIGARLRNEESGIIASSLMLLCYPLYEINFWGGYSSLLSIVYMYLLLFHLSTKSEGFAYKLIVFITAFSMVLTHQFATFLTITILIFYALISFLVFRRSFTRTFIVAVLGALAAFVLWYVPVILPYINVLISHIFFGERTYLNLTWRVTLDVFLMSFGFIILFAFLGALLTFYNSKKRKELEFYTLLFLSFLIPLVLTQSYLFGILLPYDRFVYYLMPSAVAFAAVITYLIVKFAFSYIINLDWKIQKNQIKVILLTSSISLLFVSRFPVLTNKVYEAVDYYSYLNPQSYDAGIWLKRTYPSEANLIVAEKPGSFFEMISSKSTIIETNPLIQREAAAETVLNLAYEIEQPFTLFRVYEIRMPYELDQYNVLIHNVWKRAAFLFDEETFLSYTKDGKEFSAKIPDLERKILWTEEKGSRKLQIQYFSKNEFILIENVEAKNAKIPIYISWTFTPLCNEIKNASFHLSIHFDLYRSFERAYVPEKLNWESPWNKPSYIEGDRKWALVDFNPETLPENYVAFNDPANGVFYAFQFKDYPNWGSIGVLSTKQIDALRLRYDFGDVNDTVSLAYSIAAFSEESYHVSLKEFSEVFNLEMRGNFAVQYRDYLTCAKEMAIQFLVFDKEKFRTEFLNSNFLQLVYSNDLYVICKVKGDNSVNTE
ncbi:MAG: hypothetical protein ACQXXG_00515 [Candidatus Bathyarchaeia archaeon]|nr:hypothetical protein [Candidatus Bathyarchaeota archaeon A05DMB-3]